VLDSANPYSHFSLDNPNAGKNCRGMLFHGVDEHGEPMIPEDLGNRRGRIHNWANANRDQDFWDDDEEDEEEGLQQPAGWILDDNDDEDIGFDLFG